MRAGSRHPSHFHNIEPAQIVTSPATDHWNLNFESQNHVGSGNSNCATRQRSLQRPRRRRRMCSLACLMTPSSPGERARPVRPRAGGLGEVHGVVRATEALPGSVNVTGPGMTLAAASDSESDF